ncbi:lipid kinase [Beijerinckia sp. L45]|uniref:lipid kinase n=1 Tax=Beijerinckia sp. L45 TaxID=1641855 RepID=UPI00131D3296|nr:lipid kinase [Beijerinckia sp. L45]
MAESPQQRRALLIVNPASRNGQQAINAALDRLQSGGIVLAESVCDRSADIANCILAHRNMVDCVIVGGGDGTLNAACPGLLATGLPFGVLPLGTANDFARSIGLPLDVGAAAEAICSGKTRKIDIGEVNGHPFFNVASVGLAADLAQHLTTDSKRRFGRLSYAISASRLLMQARPFHATLLIGEQKTMVRTMQITVGNGRFYGGGNIVATDAQIDDGHLDLYSLEFSQVWRMALMIRTFKKGGHGAVDEVRTARGASFEVITRRPRPVNADGELVTQTPARFTQRRQALSVYVPVMPLLTAPL